jgi:hypothetical protein
MFEMRHAWGSTLHFFLFCAILISLLGSTGGVTPAYAALPAGLTAADWEQILALLTPTQQAYFKAFNAERNDFFGRSVAVSGDTVVIGAYGEGSNATGVNGDKTNNSAALSGAAYVFVRSGGTWSQQAYLKASNTGSNDQFGISVSISGDTIVIGAHYEDSNATGANGNGTDNSAADSGAAYVFTRSGTTWSQQAYLKASNTEAGDYFGYSVAVSNDTIVVGAYSEDSGATGVNGNETDNSAPNAGAAYVFTRSGTIWSQQAYLKASNAETNDFFGRSVAVSGDTIVIGAYGEDSNATGVNGDEMNNSASFSGAAYVFTRNGSIWNQQAYLKGSNTEIGDTFGWSVSISGDTIVVGAHYEDSNATGVDGNGANNSAFSSGAAYVYVRSSGTWSQQAYLKASNTEANDYFGWSTAVSGDTIIVGAYAEDSNATGANGNGTDNSAADSGAAYVFTRSGTTWSQQAYLKASNTEAGDYFGYSVAVSNDTIVVGAYSEDSGATGVNGNETDNSAPNAGAAYVSLIDSTAPTIVSIIRASASPTSATSVDFTVNFSEVVTGVDASDFSLNTDLTGASISAVNGSGSSYTVTVSTGSGNGNLRLDILDTAVITDPALNALTGLPYTGGESYTIDKTAPAVVSITRASINPTSANSVDFIVTFSEAVTNIDTLDFSLVSIGVTGASISTISGSGGSYTVTVSTGNKPGILRLDIPPTATITDLTNNALSYLPFTTGEVYTINKNPTFTDVPFNHWSWQYIEKLYNAGITGGCSASPMMYCPDNSVTRAQMAVFLLRGEHGSTYTPPAATGTVFGDVPLDYWAGPWIEQLAAEGITGGCGNGNYCPDLPVTRDQMAVFLLRAEHGSAYVPPAPTGLFTDIPTDYWAAAWIEQLAVEGITGGCSTFPMMYCPATVVNRAQMAVFLVRAFNLP